MNPDDPRHGTTRGHNAGCRDQCCAAAKLRYDKRRRADEMAGLQRKVPSWRAVRRIQGLRALGWSVPIIAERCGMNERSMYNIGRREMMYGYLFEAIDRVFREMSMTVPQGPLVHRNRIQAARKGWAPPLAWDDIDDPSETPKGVAA